MTAGATSCSCTVCGTVCTGRFAGCAAVWARGPREVSVDAPHFAHAEVKVRTDLSLGDDADARWRLPLDPLTKPIAPAVKKEVEAPAPLITTNGNGHAADIDHFEQEEHAPDPAEIAASLESPDITARFAVAQLTELNERVEKLTDLATETTAESLEKVHGELRRLTSMREVDLTEQAAGIFGAVQAGTAALESFATVVREVTDDLRQILNDSLAALGGADGLAATIADAQADVTSIREDFGAALARIERDLSVMRQRIPAKAAAQAAPVAKVTDDQINAIIDAVTDAVIGQLNAEGSRRRR